MVYLTKGKGPVKKYLSAINNKTIEIINNSATQQFILAITVQSFCFPFFDSFWIFFSIALRRVLGTCHYANLKKLILITAPVLNFWPKGQQKPCNKVTSLRLAEYPVGLELVTSNVTLKFPKFRKAFISCVQIFTLPW